MRSAPRPQPACYNALPSGDSGLAFRLRSFLRGDGTPPPSRGNGLLDYVHPAWDAPEKKRRCPTICCNIGHRAEKSVSFMLWNLQRPGLTGCCSGAPITRKRERVIPGRQSDVRERGSSPRPAGASARSWTERPSWSFRRLSPQAHSQGPWLWLLMLKSCCNGLWNERPNLRVGSACRWKSYKIAGSRRPRPRPIFRQSIAMAIARRITRRGIQVLSPSFAFRFDGGGP